MTTYEVLIEAKNKIGKLRQVKTTHLCGGGKISGEMFDFIVAKTHDDKTFYIKPEDADNAEKIINGTM